jgi:(1->4)-alpha-D-glucan 1-alpha-D-glucosylmutase
MNAPRATMRLQLHRDFTFTDATRLVPYMVALGISHLYASPILTARPGSMHGYDVIDPTRVNPELGGEAGLRDLVAALRGAGLGLIVDIVPNHMAAGGVENPWWGDVLRHGRASRYAGFFDIDWHADDKLLAPFLGDPYGEALRSGAIKLVRDDAGASISYFDNRFPLRPEDHHEIAVMPQDAFDAATEAGRARLHHLLERQHYRLAWWRSAGDAINWRRFFDINGLVGLRVEDEAVFEATHATLLRLYREGLIDGVRVDHIDGLADPPGYCRRLRSRLHALSHFRPADAQQGKAWLVVEKILGTGERLPDDWSVDGTSGYDFMDQVNALLHDPSGATVLRRFWGAVSGRTTDFGAEEIAARQFVLAHSFAAQLDALVAALHRLALSRIETRDVTQPAIRRGLVALLAHFPVYRGYGWGQRSDALTSAMSGAMRDCRAADRPMLALLEAWLGESATPEIAVGLQQLSAPLAAKAVEDTAFYRYGVLLSRNEVGADLRRFSITPADFHAACLERHRRFPDAMLATATHDHKRGEDVRARLAVLSEIPQEWERAVLRWFAMNASHRRSGDAPMPSPADELMLYQMIVGAWPIDGFDVQDYTERLAGWQLKALREAKLATDWEAPNLEYEDAARSFLYTIMSDVGFVGEAAGFAQRIGPAGAVNGLTQTLLKLTVPGVPDFYQGAEFWDQSMVDPDNRRPVDFARRIEAMRANLAPAGLLPHWRDGRVKQAVISRVLALRGNAPMLFSRGDYRPLNATGVAADHVVAFLRSHEKRHCLVVVIRFSTRLLSDEDSIVIREGAWRDTVLQLPQELEGVALRNVLGGDSVSPLCKNLPIGAVLRTLPVGLLATD